MPRYSLAGVELAGEKKPSEKEPPSETMTPPAESVFPTTSRSSEEHDDGSERKRNKTTAVGQADIFIRPSSTSSGVFSQQACLDTKPSYLVCIAF